MSDSSPGISAIVLAAGLSRRAAPHNKLLQPAPGRPDVPVIRATVAAVLDAGVDEVIVVTGHQRAEVGTVLSDLPVRCIFAGDYRHGMGHSLAAGVRATAATADGIMIVPGDLPDLTTETVSAIVRRFRELHGAKHVVPTFQIARGHPVILKASMRSDLERLTGDIGARALLASDRERESVTFYAVDDPAIVRDVDAGG